MSDSQQEPRLSARAHVEAVAIMRAMRELISDLAPYDTEPPDPVKAADVWLRENHPAPVVYMSALRYEGDQPTIDDLPALHVVDEAQRAALPILAAHVEWWLHSQEHEPMPHPVDTLEDAVRAADGARADA